MPTNKTIRYGFLVTAEEIVKAIAAQNGLVDIFSELTNDIVIKLIKNYPVHDPTADYVNDTINSNCKYLIELMGDDYFGFLIDSNIKGADYFIGDEINFPGDEQNSISFDDPAFEDAINIIKKRMLKMQFNWENFMERCDCYIIFSS